MALDIDTALMPLLPEYYATIQDYRAIMETEEEELRQLAVFMRAVYNNFFIGSLDENAAAMWEELLGIAATEGQSLPFRRTVILNRISMRPPFTLQFLYQKLDELIGHGKWEVAMDYEDYTLYVESAAESQAYAIEVAYTVEHIKPAHIVYINRPLLIGSILLSEQVYGSTLIYNYKLRSWALGQLPFRNRTEEALYKMSSAKSITADMISDVATYMSSDVVSARINGTEVITNLEKTTADGLLTITYDIPVGAVSTINKIELLGAGSKVLTTSNVYIPVASGTEIKHKILTQEGE